MWSDESGLKECTKGNTPPPSPQWSWVGGLVPAGPTSATSLHFSNNYFTHLSGVRVGCGLRRPGRDGPRGLAVRCGLPRVRPPPPPLALWVHTPGDAGLNAGPSFVQQHVPRTQNHEGLRQTQEVDEVTGRAGGGVSQPSSSPGSDQQQGHVFPTQEVPDRAESPLAAGAPPPSERRLPDAVSGPERDGAGPRLGHQREGGRVVPPGRQSPEPSGEDERRSRVFHTENGANADLATPPRGGPGCTWALTSPSSPSAWAGPTRCGPSPGTGPSSTGAPCPNRTPQVRNL